MNYFWPYSHMQCISLLFFIFQEWKSDRFGHSDPQMCSYYNTYFLTKAITVHSLWTAVDQTLMASSIEMIQLFLFFPLCHVLNYWILKYGFLSGIYSTNLTTTHIIFKNIMYNHVWWLILVFQHSRSWGRKIIIVCKQLDLPVSFSTVGLQSDKLSPKKCSSPVKNGKNDLHRHLSKRRNTSGQQMHGKCSLSLTIRNIQTKIMRRYYLIKVRMATLTKIRSNKGCQTFKEKKCYTPW